MTRLVPMLLVSLLTCVRAAAAQPVECPTRQDLPVELPAGCPSPVTGDLYPPRHDLVDRRLDAANREAEAKATSAASALERLSAETEGRVSWVWVVVGVMTSLIIGSSM